MHFPPASNRPNTSSIGSVARGSSHAMSWRRAERNVRRTSLMRSCRATGSCGEKLLVLETQLLLGDVELLDRRLEILGGLGAAR